MLIIDSDDDIKFIRQVGNLINGAIQTYEPLEIFVVKIDNWFDSKWAGFSRKILGALAIRDFQNLTIPPFVPNRVMHQNLYCRGDKNTMKFEKKESKPLHIKQSSSNNFGRFIKNLTDSAIFVWYSGSTLKNKQGSVMIYWVKDQMAFGWYVAFALKNEDWELGRTAFIPRKEVIFLINDHHKSGCRYF